ncbi:RHS repeat-associated core domain-containing protein [Mucilaginibacter sp.]|uniref:RHS repeat domain-containing protein n=1 Tax=Mucilaginibacter sp. TaxID=1882438 RepID=UPI0025E72099|nr:RHS repeat-associated core domain-containing protein [Mucilaginibacter sp.]
MKYYIFIVLLLKCSLSFCQVNLLQNGDFSSENYAWQTNGDFHYDRRFSNGADGQAGYAYLATNIGNPADRLYGELYQSVTIPSGVSTVTFDFEYSVSTSEPNVADNDFLHVGIYIGTQEVFPIFNISNRSNTWSGSGYAKTASITIPPELYNQTITVKFIGSTNQSYPTVFRVDNVELLASFGPPGIRTNCITWTNGNLPSAEVINAADNLCNQHYIPNYIDVPTLANFSVINASVATLNALYKVNIPTTLPSDYFPTFFGDIDSLSSTEKQAIKAMCFLEYDDGRSCLSRDYTFITPHNRITTGNILRMLYEAWNIQPDMDGYDIFNHSSSFFFQGVYYDDYNYGYFKRAFEDGILGSYVFNFGFPDNINVNPGEFYLVVLSNLVNKYGQRFISSNNFYNPNNIQLSNSSTPTDITRGVFKTYEQSEFSIPSGGIGLNFVYSYHSDWIDIPSLGYNEYFNKWGNFDEQLAKERIFPLGIGWTHTYNIFAQSVLDQYNNDRYIIIRLGDGSILVYNALAGKFESSGVYDKFIITNKIGGHITSFNLVSKNQVTTQFNISTNSNENLPSFFYATTIRDQNNQSLTFNYERSHCDSTSERCFGSSAERLYRVIDNFSGRILNFHYVPGSDLLAYVSDNSNRTIHFSVNRTKLNLAAVTDANLNITNYVYGSSDVDNHLLTSIIKPQGNTINNTYAARKLKQTQTPDYVTKVDFTAAYSQSSIGTQSVITTTPSSGTQYSITYNQSAAGTVSNIKSASSDITLTYGDSQNPTLPTVVVDNQSNIRENFQYDNMGNVLRSDYSGGGQSQTNQYTYDPTNHVTSHTWPNNTITYYSYDPNGNETNETTSNYKMDYGYFSTGLPATKTDANGVVTNFGYNQYGNLNSISISGTPIHYAAEYDEVSRLKSITDGNQVKTTYGYDKNDNLKEVIQDPDRLNIKTSYQYDGNDNLRFIEPPQGQGVSLTYNQSDDLTDELQLGLTRHWSYNSDGTLNTYIDKDNVAFGHLYYPTNDPNEGKLKTNGIENYSYSANTHLVTSISANQSDKGTLNYGYDQLLRPNDISFNSPTYSADVTYNYDISGNITKINLVNENKSFTYDYDELNRIKTIRDWNQNTIVTYNYKNNGLLDYEQLSNGIAIFYHYDAANRLDSIYSLSGDRVKVIHSVGCTMDNNGNHLRESSFVNWPGKPGTTYTPQSNATFTYDKDFNFLLQANGKTLDNDGNGNISRNGFNGFSDGIFDRHNNLTSCNVDGEARAYLYDSSESRYCNNDLRYTIDHVNNSNVLAVKRLGVSDPIALYVYSPYGLVCSINSQTADPTFYMYDFRGSTVATVDKNQTIADYYKYDPWGNVLEASSSPGKNTPFLFVGKYGVMYESPHLYFMRARYFDPTIGRFLGADANWSTNLFSYSDNNPVTNIDPSGQLSLKEILVEFISDVGGVLKNTGLTRVGNNGALYLEKASGRVFQGNQSVVTASLSKVGKRLAYFQYLGIAMSAADVVNTYKAEGNRVDRQTMIAYDNKAGSFIGSWSGAEIGAGQGAITGAAIGVLFFGVGEAPGAVIGGVIGGIAGGFAGGYLLRHLGDTIFGQ